MEIKYTGNIILQADNPFRKFLVDVRYMPDDSPKPVVLFVHGFKGFKDWGTFNLMADYFAEAGFVFIKMNFSHNGTTIDQPLDFANLEAFGNNNFSIEQDDIEIVLDKLFDNNLIISSETDLTNVYLIGHSRGGAATIIKASTDVRIKKLATLAAMNDMASRYPDEVMGSWKEDGVYYVYNGRTKQQMPLYYQIVENYEQNEERLNVKRSVETMGKPFLALHGTEDETLPISMLHEMKCWNDEIEIVEMKKANHTFGSVHPYVQDALPEDLNIAIDYIIQFFKK